MAFSMRLLAWLFAFILSSTFMRFSFLRRGRSSLLTMKEMTKLLVVSFPGALARY